MTEFSILDWGPNWVPSAITLLLILKLSDEEEFVTGSTFQGVFSEVGTLGS